MKVESSYAVEIKNVNKIFRETINIYKNAVSFCIKAFENEWDTLSSIEDTNRKYNVAEHLIHSTKENSALYVDFDRLFYKMPSFLRRNAIAVAIGHLNSYHSNLPNWENSNKVGKPPTLQTKINTLPTFYKGGCYGGYKSDNILTLKLFKNNDWIWVDIKVNKTDSTYIRKHCVEGKLSNPTLEKRNKKWYLRFCFSKEVPLNKTPLKEQTILAVDLGINTDATCSIMKCDGTVLARRFINFPSEKDHIYHTLNKIKKNQQLNKSATKLWRIVKFDNEELACKIAATILNLSKEYNCDVIVFEYLDTHGKKKGKNKQKLAMWKKNTIQNIVTNKAHRNGIRISHVCAWGTSQLAFDGSGKVLRGRDANLPTYELCEFSNGRLYNCDLSASYNIGARYFIRELQKSISEKKWSDIAAKVPECQKRTQCTYNTLLKIMQ